MRFVVALCTAFLLSFVVVVPAQAELVIGILYGNETWSPGEQHGGVYDCPVQSIMWIENSFSKSGNYLGKSIFINGNGNWIAAAEDASNFTVLYRPDLESTYKKGSAKNTSSVTYSGNVASWYDNNHSCV
jgi:hypothetical protein